RAQKMAPPCLGRYNSPPSMLTVKIEFIPMNIRELLNQKVLDAMAAVGVPNDLPALIAPGKKAGFGDYQATCAMGAAKVMGTNPRELAGKIVAALELDNIAEKLEIAGPGFINIHLKPEWLGEQ